MANAELKITSDVEQAKAGMRELGASTEMLEKHIDKFSDRNKAAAKAVEFTSGKLAGMQSESKGLEREMQRLIKSGIDPQSAQIQKLKTQYDGLQKEIKETDKDTKKQQTTFSDATKSIAAYAAAFVAFKAAAGIIKSFTVNLSTMGDEIAKTSRRIGISGEALQELRFAADRSGVSAEELTSGFENMNKALGQAAAGTGRLNTFLQKSNPELLKTIKAASGSEEAFMTLVEAIRQTEDPMQRAALATAAFGGAGQKIISLAEEGEAGIAGLRAEAQRYGNIMSGDALKAAENFKDAQTNMNASLKAVATQLGAPLLQPLANAMNAFAMWASEGNRLVNLARDFSPLIAALGAAAAAMALVAVATKIWTIAQTALNVALAANPIGLIVVGIAALGALLIYMIANFDMVKFRAIATFEAMKINALMAFEYIKVGIGTAVVFIIKALMTIHKPFILMINNIIGAFNRLTGKNVPMLSDAMDTVSKEAEKIIGQSQNRIKELEAAKAAHTAKVKAQEIEMHKAAEKAKQEESVKASQTAAAMDAENFTTKMATKASQFEQEKAAKIAENEEMINLEKEKAAAIAAQEKALFDMKVQFMQESLGNTQSMLGDLQTVFKNAGKESRELAQMMKAVSIAEATINTYVAFNKALAAFPPPLSYVAAGITLAAGLAKVAAIASTPIPSAQTGGQFTVPDTPATRNDRAAVMASAGETVTVTPRGESSAKDIHVNVELAEGVLFRAVQRGIDTGKINVSSRNIGRAVFA